MLENIVAWVLNNYIGEYLEDLNTDQLSVALLSGQVELENVPLKKTALRKLDLPLEVKSGLLGKLTLSASLTHIRSEPWTLKLSDVLIVVGPLSPSRRYDVEAVEQVEQQKKETMLGELEQRHKTELLTIMGVSTTVSQDSWWGASLISTVLNNIQLIMNNVHIRYEDGSTLPNGLAFNCGVRIQKMTVQTTNSNWKPGFVESPEGVNVFKKLDLQGFSIYWNSDQKLSADIKTPKELRDALAPESHSSMFIIHPCSAELRMEKNSSKFPLKGNQPRFKFFLRPGKITCELTRRQMAELRAVNREWARFERARQHRKWRPLTTVGENAREWWRFAYDRVTEEGRRAQSRRTWHFALTRARHLNAYCRAYRRRLLAIINNPTASDAIADPATATTLSTSQLPLSQEDRTIMKQIERDAQYSYHELHLFRETVFRQLMREKEKETGISPEADDVNEDTYETLEEAQMEDIPVGVGTKDETGKGLYGWITSFFVAEDEAAVADDKSFDFGNLDLSELKNLPKSFNYKEVEDEILDVLHESWDDSTLLRRDLLLSEIALRLENITLRFIDSNITQGIEQRRVLAMDLSGVTSRVELSPRQHSLSVQLAVQDMSIQRIRTGHPPPRSTSASRIDDSLLYSLSETTKILLAVGRSDVTGSDEKEPIFRMQYRRRSPRLVVRHTVEGRFRPVSVMYEENALAGLSTLFADDPLMFQVIGDSPLSTPTNSAVTESIIESHVFVNVYLPVVSMEVRRRGWSSAGPSTVPEWEPGEAFASLTVHDVSLGVSSNEQYLSQVKIGIGHMEMKDLLEGSSYPLLSTGRSINGLSKPLSNSCPDLADCGLETFSHCSSLPNQGFLTNMAAVHGAHRKISAAPQMDGKTVMDGEATILVTLADSRHAQFDSIYKKNCSVDVVLNELDLGMNRRTWTALLDLAGVLGVEETEDDCTQREDADEDISIKPSLDAYSIGCSIRMKSLRVDMHYPRNQTRLGAVHFTETEILTTIKLNEMSETVSVVLMLEGMRVDDRTPLYSEMYPERMALIDERGIVPSRVQLHIVKYLGDDPTRECDLRLRLIVPDTMHMYYLHTHRYFCGIMDYWMQFFELQDQVAKSKRHLVEEGVAARVSLDIDIRCPTTLMLPMNQFSDQVVILECSGVRMTNEFRRLSEVADLFTRNAVDTDYGYDEAVNCLLDCGRVVLSDLKVFEGRRIEKSSRKLEQGERLLARGVFENYEFLSSTSNVFSKRFDLSTQVFRNLDSAQSHNAPDLTIITGVRELNWRMTTDFYVLFRGMLEKNLGDPLIAVPETIPMEILQKPTSGCELSVLKYATMSFRLMFEDVEFDCEVPSPSQPHSSSSSPFARRFSPFARMQLCSSRVAFDVFIDGQSELDLICESTQLIDTRPGIPGKKDKNVFTTILRPRDSDSEKKRLSLMSEAHLMMKKDEPPALTLVLMNARVLLLPDWLNDAKEFVLLATDFVPKYSDEPPKPVMISSRADGVVGRRSHGEPQPSNEQTMSVKITLRDSDLYLLENTSVRNSFALVASTTAVLNMNDAGGEIAGNLEIQSMTVGWCSLHSEDTNVNLCSNDFSVGIGLTVERQPAERKTNQAAGLPQLSQPRHTAEVEIRRMIGRLSYKDARVLKAVLEGFQKHIADTMDKSLVPVIAPKPPPKDINLGKVSLKTEHADLWLLDDFQGSSIPLLRLSVSDVNIERHPERVVAALTASVDYFNQRVFGWEPLVEKWSILRFLWRAKDNQQTVELTTQTKSTLDVNLTEQLMQQAVQFSARWPAIRASFERDDFRSACIKSRSDHLPYLLKNETGCEILFTTAVEDVQAARNSQRKAAVRWLAVHKGKTQTFEFPAKLLLYSQSEREPPRQLIVRVEGWDEISPVNVDACGTYFRIVKANKSGLPNARLVIGVTMEKDGKKVVAVRSSIDIDNQLPHAVAVYADGNEQEMMRVDSSSSLPVPLAFAHSQFLVEPVGAGTIKDRAEVSWRTVRRPGEMLNRTQRLETADRKTNYWLCSSVRREYYPEDETLPGHSIHVIAPLTIQNLLPIDIEVRIQDQTFAVTAGKQVRITTVDITREMAMSVFTDRLRSFVPCYISKTSLADGQLLPLQLTDALNRPLDMYASCRLTTGGAISMSLWVPYWIVNKSGIPVVLKQEAASAEAAGQGEEHERAKDRHPLMFSFADDGCPKQCVVRMGSKYVADDSYRPRFSQRFSLTPGVQALKLRLEHETMPTLYYNIGVEVRAGTGRYKDTQVVLLTSRYVLSNLSSYTLSVCHNDMKDRSSEHVHVTSQSTVVWNEKVEDQRRLCVRRADVRHWSCPFRIDRIGSFHVTMRDADETPRFVRVEIILSSAVFCVTFTDAELYPPPIRIENLSDVPVLYQQNAERSMGNHLRAICKMRSHVDYSWDDMSGDRRLLLQVFEDKSHVYDPAHSGKGEPMVYENHSFIQLANSFNDVAHAKNTDECELVLETLQKGKVMLNKQNGIRGNNGNQLWSLCADGCLENIGMTSRSRGKENRLVLDVLEKTGYQLMMTERNPSRDKYQKWTLMPDGRLCLQQMPYLLVTARRTEVCLAEHDRAAAANHDGVALTQMWRVARQRAGSGILDVECLYSGPTLVVRITDRSEKSRAKSVPALPSTPQSGILDVSVTMRSGFGMSLVNGSHEELLYARLGGIVANARRVNGSYQMTASVDVIQVDNQLLGADRFPVLFCQAELPSEDEISPVPTSELPAGVPASTRPALKLEMNCTPMKHYDAFDCFRLKLCDLSVQLNELLLWKLVQFAQASDAAASVQQKTLCLPPNIELDRPDPLRTRRWYFGTLDLEMGQIALSVVTVPKSALPRECRQLKQQFNVKLVSFENAAVSLPPFRQFHYFETSTFLLETLRKFYSAELQKQTLNIVVTLDAFGNPLGLVTDLRDSFQGLFIEGDVQRFVAGLGYGVSNSISKMASSMASGVGSLTFDQAHEARRRHNMIRSQSTSSTPLTHLYSGVKGLGVGVFGGVTAILTNTIAESRKSGIMSGALRGITTGAVDTVTKPVQGLFDLVEGTASAMKELAGPAAVGTRRGPVSGRVRPPRVCRDLFHLLPPYSLQHAKAQMEMLRINGFSQKERLLDVEVCLEQFTTASNPAAMQHQQHHGASLPASLVRQYVLISTEQCYVCRQVNDEPSSVIQRIAYKYLKAAVPQQELIQVLAHIEVQLETADRTEARPMLVWCSRIQVARRLADKMMRAKHEYDHSKRTLSEQRHALGQD